jgi:hypothetical protein
VKVTEEPVEHLVVRQPPSARDGLRHAVIVAASVRAIFFPLAWASVWLHTTTPGALHIGFFEVWNRWDASILLRIAEFGYTSAADPHATAFFPLFPLIVRAFHAAGIGYLAAGLTISGVSSVVAFTYLWRIAEEEIGPGAGHRAQLYLALFPTAVFLIAPYTEALFLAGATAAFYYARRERWALVGFPAAVAMGARFAGLFLLAGLAVEFVRQRRWSARRILEAIAALVIGALPLGAYMAFLSRSHRGAFAFVHAQKEGWGRAFVGPKRAFLATLQDTNGQNFADWIFAWKVEILAAAIGCLLVILALRKREWGYATFMGTTMAVLVTSSWYYSIPRMLLSLFPIVLFLAARTERRPQEHQWWLTATTAVATLGVTVFANYLWFF